MGIFKGHIPPQGRHLKVYLENKMSEIDKQLNELLLQKAEILHRLKKLERHESAKP